MRVYAPVRPNRALGPALRDALIAALGETYERLEGPVVLRVRFIFKPPPAASPFARSPVAELSIFELTRLVANELAGEAYLDERQVVALHVGKEYGNANAIDVLW